MKGNWNADSKSKEQSEKMEDGKRKVNGERRRGSGELLKLALRKGLSAKFDYDCVICFGGLS